MRGNFLSWSMNKSIPVCIYLFIYLFIKKHNLGTYLEQTPIDVSNTYNEVFAGMLNAGMLNTSSFRKKLIDV